MRRVAIVIVGVMAYLMTLGVLDHMDNVAKAKLEQQRYFNVHQ